MRATISDEPILLGETAVKVTCSIGVSMWKDGAPANSTDIIDRADKALYQAKKTGRNKVEMSAELQD